MKHEEKMKLRARIRSEIVEGEIYCRSQMIDILDFDDVDAAERFIDAIIDSETIWHDGVRWHSYV